MRKMGIVALGPKPRTTKPAPGSDAVKNIVDRAGLQIEEAHRAPGLYTLRIPAAKLQPGALAAAIAFLNAQPEVRFAEPNYLGFNDLELSNSSPSRAGWHFDLIDLAGARARGDGSSEVIVAVIDSGVDLLHPALTGALLSRQPGENWDFVDNNGDPVDDQGHGTFIAGLLVGNGAQGVNGICPVGSCPCAYRLPARAIPIRRAPRRSFTPSHTPRPGGW